MALRPATAWMHPTICLANLRCRKHRVSRRICARARARSTRAGGCAVPASTAAEALAQAAAALAQAAAGRRAHQGPGRTQQQTVRDAMFCRCCLYAGRVDRRMRLGGNIAKHCVWQMWLAGRCAQRGVLYTACQKILRNAMLADRWLAQT